MRKIESVEDKEKRSKRRSRILVILMIIILGGSYAGYSFLSSPNDNVKNKETTDANGKWILNYNGVSLRLSNSPSSVRDISVTTSSIIEDYSGKILYIDSQNSGITNEIASTLGLYTNKVQAACYGKCDRNLPEKTCSDNIIIFNATSENKVYQKDNCVFIEGDMRAADAFLYKMFS